MTISWRGSAGILGVLVATFLGFGAVEEIVVPGIRGGEVQPLLVGLVGAFVSLLLAIAALALSRRSASARRLAIAAALASLAFHSYAALPPHRNVGLLALAVAAAYGAMLLGIVLRHPTGNSG